MSDCQYRRLSKKQSVLLKQAIKRKCKFYTDFADIIHEYKDSFNHVIGGRRSINPFLAEKIYNALDNDSRLEFLLVYNLIGVDNSANRARGKKYFTSLMVGLEKKYLSSNNKKRKELTSGLEKLLQK